MAIFNSYVSHYQRVVMAIFVKTPAETPNSWYVQKRGPTELSHEEISYQSAYVWLVIEEYEHIDRICTCI
jgi:hypothetical protein